MALILIFILLGLGLLAKHQVETLVYQYKRIEICPEKSAMTAEQAFARTRLACKYTRRKAVLIPGLRMRVELPMTSEIWGLLILIVASILAFYFSESFPILFSVALGGVSWIFFIKFVLIKLLRACDAPSIKHVIIAMTVYPLAVATMYLILFAVDYFNIYDLPSYCF